METCCNLFCDGTARVFFSDAHDMRGAADETIIRNIHVWASVLRLLERDAMQVLCLRPRCHQGTSRPRPGPAGRAQEAAAFSGDAGQASNSVHSRFLT